MTRIQSHNTKSNQAHFGKKLSGTVSWKFVHCSKTITISNVEINGGTVRPVNKTGFVLKQGKIFDYYR